MYIEYLRSSSSDTDAIFKIAIEDNDDRPSLVEFYTSITETDTNYKKIKFNDGIFTEVALSNGYKIGLSAIDNATTLLRNSVVLSDGDCLQT